MTPEHIVVMGVSGAGKSAIGSALRDVLGWPLAEGYDFHPAQNLARIAAGQPLDDELRVPWLRSLAAWAHERHAAGESTVMTCSALKRSYRDILRAGASSTRFVHLVADESVLRARMYARQHVMPPALLESQLATLEPLDADELGVTVDVSGSPEETVRAVLDKLGLRT